MVFMDLPQQVGLLMQTRSAVQKDWHQGYFSMKDSRKCFICSAILQIHSHFGSVMGASSRCGLIGFWAMLSSVKVNSHEWCIICPKGLNIVGPCLRFRGVLRSCSTGWRVQDWLFLQRTEREGFISQTKKFSNIFLQEA